MDTSDSSEYTVTEYIGPNGKPGKIVRDSKGHFMPGTVSHAPITKENYPVMHQHRIELYRQAAAERMGVDIAAVDPIVANTPPKQQHIAAYAALVGATAQQIYASDKPRGEDLKVLASLIGATDNSISHEGAPPDWGNFLQNSTVKITIEHKPDDIVDAQAIDTDT